MSKQREEWKAIKATRKVDPNSAKELEAAEAARLAGKAKREADLAKNKKGEGSTKK